MDLEDLEVEDEDYEPPNQTKILETSLEPLDRYLEYSNQFGNLNFAEEDGKINKFLN